MSRSTHKPYSQMTADELAAATADLDREHVELPGRPLNKREREEHRKARKMGRPKKGAGSAVIGISVEKSLLKRADALAKARKVGRSQLFVALLQAELASAGDATTTNAAASAVAAPGRVRQRKSRGKASTSQNGS